jgi:hypothetical protein
VLIGEEVRRGSIYPGKLADFAVLTDGFPIVPVDIIPQMKALLTVVGGKEAYRDLKFGGDKGSDSNQPRATLAKRLPSSGCSPRSGAKNM